MVCLLTVKAMITVTEFFVLLICTFWRSKRVTMFGAWTISQFCFAYFVFHIFCLVDNRKIYSDISRSLVFWSFQWCWTYTDTVENGIVYYLLMIPFSFSYSFLYFLFSMTTRKIAASTNLSLYWI